MSPPYVPSKKDLLEEDAPSAESFSYAFPCAATRKIEDNSCEISPRPGGAKDG